MGMVWEAAFPSPAARLVALKLADCANDDGASIWPSRGTIERHTGLGATAVKEWLAAFDRAGLTVVERRGDGTPGKRTTIRSLNVETLVGLASGAARWERAADTGWTIERGPPSGPGREAAPVTQRPPRGRTESSPGPSGGPNPSINRQRTHPHTAGAGNVVADWLRAEAGGVRKRAVTLLLAPVLAELPLAAPEPAAALDAIADEAERLDDAALTAAAAALLADRKANVRPSDIRAAMRSARKAGHARPVPTPAAAGPMTAIRIIRGEPAFDAWIAALPTDPRATISAAGELTASHRWPAPGRRVHAPVRVQLAEVTA